MKFINTTERIIPINGMQSRGPGEIRDVKTDRMIMTLFRSLEIRNCEELEIEKWNKKQKR